MPHSKQQRPRMEAPLEAKDIELYHLGRHRPGGPPPATSRNSSDDAMPRVAVRPALYVTSNPDKFWRTKRGIALSVLVVLALLGGIVGGVIGAEKGNNDTSRRNFGLPSSTGSNSTQATPTSAPPSVAPARTETVTEIVSRSVPRRYLLSFVDDSAPEATPTATQ